MCVCVSYCCVESELYGGVLSDSLYTEVWQTLVEVLASCLNASLVVAGPHNTSNSIASVSSVNQCREVVCQCVITLTATHLLRYTRAHTAADVHAVTSNHRETEVIADDIVRMRDGDGVAHGDGSRDTILSEIVMDLVEDAMVPNDDDVSIGLSIHELLQLFSFGLRFLRDVGLATSCSSLYLHIMSSFIGCEDTQRECDDEFDRLCRLDECYTSLYGCCVMQANADVLDDDTHTHTAADDVGELHDNLSMFQCARLFHDTVALLSYLEDDEDNAPITLLRYVSHCCHHHHHHLHLGCQCPAPSLYRHYHHHHHLSATVA